MHLRIYVEEGTGKNPKYVINGSQGWMNLGCYFTYSSLKNRLTVRLLYFLGFLPTTMEAIT